MIPPPPPTSLTVKCACACVQRWRRARLPASRSSSRPNTSRRRPCGRSTRSGWPPDSVLRCSSSELRSSSMSCLGRALSAISASTSMAPPNSTHLGPNKPKSPSEFMIPRRQDQDESEKNRFLRSKKGEKEEEKKAKALIHMLMGKNM